MTLTIASCKQETKDKVGETDAGWKWIKLNTAA
jgi:hypothetical protein